MSDLLGSSIYDGMITEYKRDHKAKYQKMADNLIMADWSPEWSQTGNRKDIMGWQWRRPTRRPGKPGMLFLSTDQAWNHMKKNAK